MKRILAYSLILVSGSLFAMGNIDDPGASVGKKTKFFNSLGRKKKPERSRTLRDIFQNTQTKKRTAEEEELDEVIEGMIEKNNNENPLLTHSNLPDSEKKDMTRLFAQIAVLQFMVENEHYKYAGILAKDMKVTLCALLAYRIGETVQKK